MKPLASTTRSSRRTAAIGVVAAALAVGATGGAYALAQSAAEPDTASVSAGEPAAPAAPETVQAAQAADTPGSLAPTSTRRRGPMRSGRRATTWRTRTRSPTCGRYRSWRRRGAQASSCSMASRCRSPPGRPWTAPTPTRSRCSSSTAYWDAGYTAADGEELAALWHVDVSEAKATAGHMLAEGQALPVPPSGTPTS